MQMPRNDLNLDYRRISAGQIKSRIIQECVKPKAKGTYGFPLNIRLWCLSTHVVHGNLSRFLLSGTRTFQSLHTSLLDLPSLQLFLPKTRLASLFSALLFSGCSLCSLSPAIHCLSQTVLAMSSLLALFTPPLSLSSGLPQMPLDIFYIPDFLFLKQNKTTPLSTICAVQILLVVGIALEFGPLRKDYTLKRKLSLLLETIKCQLLLNWGWYFFLNSSLSAGVLFGLSL